MRLLFKARMKKTPKKRKKKKQFVKNSTDVFRPKVHNWCFFFYIPLDKRPKTPSWASSWWGLSFAPPLAKRGSRAAPGAPEENDSGPPKWVSLCLFFTLKLSLTDECSLLCLEWLGMEKPSVKIHSSWALITWANCIWNRVHQREEPRHCTAKEECCLYDIVTKG